MYCTKCGTELPDTAKFCMECGTSTPLGPQRSPSTQTTPAQHYIELAETALEIQNWEEAGKYFSKSLEIRPDDARAWVGRILAALEYRNFTEFMIGDESIPPWDYKQSTEQIMPFLKKALQSEPNNPEAVLLMGYVSGDPSLVKPLLRIPTVRSLAEGVLKLLAVRLIGASLTLKYAKIGWSLRPQYPEEQFVVKNKDLLSKALAIPEVREQIDMDEILRMRFPLTTYRSRSVDDVGRTTEHEGKRYLKGFPSQGLADYLGTTLGLPKNRVAQELSFNLNPYY